jgi:hypothetical protein
VKRHRPGPRHSPHAQSPRSDGSAEGMGRSTSTRERKERKREREREGGRDRERARESGCQIPIQSRPNSPTSWMRTSGGLRPWIVPAPGTGVAVGVLCVQMRASRAWPFSSMSSSCSNGSRWPAATYGKEPERGHLGRIQKRRRESGATTRIGATPWAATRPSQCQ